MARQIPTLWHMLEGPPSRAVLMTAKSINLDLKLRLCRTYQQEHLDPKYVARNPLYTVPFLEDGDVSLTDSHAITQYLVETREPTSNLIGHTVKDRAILNDRLFFDTLLFQKCKSIMAPVYRGTETEVTQEKLDELGRCLDVLDLFVKNGKWIAGDHVTLADLHVLPTITNLKAAGIDVTSNYPHIVEWLHRCEKLPGFDENLEGATSAGNLFKLKLEENSQKTHELPKIEP